MKLCELSSCYLRKDSSQSFHLAPSCRFTKFSPGTVLHVLQIHKVFTWHRPALAPSCRFTIPRHRAPPLKVFSEKASSNPLTTSRGSGFASVVASGELSMSDLS